MTTWADTLWWANCCARYTRRRFRVYRRTFTGGRVEWDCEPIGGWPIDKIERLTLGTETLDGTAKPIGWSAGPTITTIIETPGPGGRYE